MIAASLPSRLLLPSWFQCAVLSSRNGFSKRGPNHPQPWEHAAPALGSQASCAGPPFEPPNWTLQSITAGGVMENLKGQDHKCYQRTTVGFWTSMISTWFCTMVSTMVLMTLRRGLRYKQLWGDRQEIYFWDCVTFLNATVHFRLAQTNPILYIFESLRDIDIENFCSNPNIWYIWNLKSSRKVNLLRIGHAFGTLMVLSSIWILGTWIYLTSTASPVWIMAR